MAPEQADGPARADNVSLEAMAGGDRTFDAPSPASGWVSHISFYQDYLTIIELEDGSSPGMKSAS